jgi:hypothetical protein
VHSTGYCPHSTPQNRPKGVGGSVVWRAACGAQKDGGAEGVGGEGGGGASVDEGARGSPGNPPVANGAILNAAPLPLPQRKITGARAFNSKPAALFASARGWPRLVVAKLTPFWHLKHFTKRGASSAACPAARADALGQLPSHRAKSGQLQDRIVVAGGRFSHPNRRQSTQLTALVNSRHRGP